MLTLNLDGAMQKKLAAIGFDSALIATAQEAAKKDKAERTADEHHAIKALQDAVSRINQIERTAAVRNSFVTINKLLSEDKTPEGKLNRLARKVLMLFTREAGVSIREDTKKKDADTVIRMLTSHLADEDGKAMIENLADLLKESVSALNDLADRDIWLTGGVSGMEVAMNVMGAKPNQTSRDAIIRAAVRSQVPAAEQQAAEPEAAEAASRR